MESEACSHHQWADRSRKAAVSMARKVAAAAAVEMLAGS